MGLHFRVLNGFCILYGDCTISALILYGSVSAAGTLAWWSSMCLTARAGDGLLLLAPCTFAMGRGNGAEPERFCCLLAGPKRLAAVKSLLSKDWHRHAPDMR